MKRVSPVNPVLPAIAREEIDLRSSSRDSRRDPGATAKISREELEEVLSRSKSGLHEAVRPADPSPRTQSGERVAVRPARGEEEVAAEAAPLAEKVPSDRPTTRPAAIEVGDTHESESDRIADEMYRAVTESRSNPSLPIARPAGDISTTVAQAPFDFVEPSSAPAIEISRGSDDDLVQSAHAHASRVRRSRIIAALVVATAALAVVAWFAGRWAAVYFRP